jgi:hypothetical protein
MGSITNLEVPKDPKGSDPKSSKSKIGNKLEIPPQIVFEPEVMVAKVASH